MPNFTAGTSFTDGVTNDVTAAKLNALVADAVPTSSLALNSTNGTIANFTASTANITLGTIPTLTAGTTTGTAGVFTFGTIPTGTFGTTTSTAATITTGTIPTLTAGTTTSTAATITNGTITNGTITTALIPTLTAGTTTGTAGIFTSGTVATLNSTTGTIANLSATTSTFLGTITGSTNVVNIGSGQIYKDASGNVGIGITSPAYKFVVSNAGAQGLEVQTTSSSLIDLHSYNRTTSSYTDTKVNCSSFIVAIGTSSATERLRIDSSGNVGIGVTGPVNKLEIVGSLGRGAPVTKTADFSLADTENWLIVNKGSSCTVTLPAASSWTGREFTIKVITAHTVVSASSNVVPRNSATPGTAILAAAAGNWATLVSNGTNWVIMCGS